MKAALSRIDPPPTPSCFGYKYELRSSFNNYWQKGKKKTPKKNLLIRCRFYPVSYSAFEFCGWQTVAAAC